MGLFSFVTNFFLSQSAVIKSRMCPIIPAPIHPPCVNMQENPMFRKEFIKNSDMKICKNCVHFIKSDYETAPLLARCRKFGIKDIVDGDVQYYYADKCRNDERLCGSIALWYEEYKNDTGNSTQGFVVTPCVSPTSPTATSPKLKPDSSNEQMHKINGVIIE